MKAIVIYKSESGFTKKIAKRIAYELGAEIIPINVIKQIELSEYDTIIYGGAVHAQRIIGLSKMKGILNKQDNPRVVVFAVGSASGDSFSIPIIKKHNLTEHEHKSIEFFYFRGGYDREKLTLSSRVLMSVVSVLVFRNLQEKKPEFKDILDIMENSADYTQTEDISPLISYVMSGDFG
jgi:menaquinone-dependent protoporphyrinogen IX oxidase